MVFSFFGGWKSVSRFPARGLIAPYTTAVQLLAIVILCQDVIKTVGSLAAFKHIVQLKPGRSALNLVDNLEIVRK